MAPDPQCAALAAAKEKTGKLFIRLAFRRRVNVGRLLLGLSYAAIAAKIGTSEQHVIDVCTAKTKPTEAEFNKLAQALNITSSVPHTGVHATA